MFFKWLAWGILTCATCLSIDGTEFGTFIDESFELNLNDIKGKGSSLYLAAGCLGYNVYGTNTYIDVHTYTARYLGYKHPKMYSVGWNTTYFHPLVFFT